MSRIGLECPETRMCAPLGSVQDSPFSFQNHLYLYQTIRDTVLGELRALQEIRAL